MKKLELAAYVAAQALVIGLTLTFVASWTFAIWQLCQGNTQSTLCRTF